MIDGGDVEVAVRDVLRDWLPGYICEAERRKGWVVGDTPVPRGWVRTGRDLQKLNPDQLPCVVIMAGGIPDPPRKEGAPGILTATWLLDIGIFFNAAWGDKSRDHAQMYARATQLVMQQRQLALPGSPEYVVDFRGEAYDEMDFASIRSYSASVASFRLEVRNIAWTAGGPPPLVTPPVDPTVPPDGWTRVTDTEITVNNEPPPEDP